MLIHHLKSDIILQMIFNGGSPLLTDRAPNCQQLVVQRDDGQPMYQKNMPSW